MISGVALVTGSLNGAVIGDSATVTFQPGPAAPHTATITANPLSVPADGISTTTIVVVLFDAQGNWFVSSGGMVTLSTTRGTLSPVTDMGDGTYRATLLSTAVGVAFVRGTLNGVPIADMEELHFTIPP